MVRRTRAEMEETRATLLATARKALESRATPMPPWTISPRRWA